MQKVRNSFVIYSIHTYTYTHITYIIHINIYTCRVYIYIYEHRIHPSYYYKISIIHHKIQNINECSGFALNIFNMYMYMTKPNRNQCLKHSTFILQFYHPEWNSWGGSFQKKHSNWLISEWHFDASIFPDKMRQ